MSNIYNKARSSEVDSDLVIPTLGVVLREFRRQRAMPQRALAIAAGLDPSVLAAIENGRRPTPKDAVLRRLASALRASDMDLRELQRGRLASRLYKVLASQPTKTSVSIILIALLLVRISDQDKVEG